MFDAAPRPEDMIPPTPETDAVLMHRLGAGEKAAARQLVDLYLDRIVGFSYRLLGDRAAAEDVAQETFLRLWKNVRRWRPDAPLSSWLHRVAYNLCIDILRRKTTVSIDDVPEPADDAAGPAKALHRIELGLAVDAAIACLPERQAAAITLVHREEMSNIEAARIMGISVEAVESLLARGRRNLRKSLSGLRAELEGEV